MKTKRNYYIDNIKGVLISLVVFGHMIEPFITDNMYLSVLYTFIYMFHMPLFIFLAGIYSKTTINKYTIKKDIKHIIFPFFLFECFYEVSYFIVQGHLSSYAQEGAPYWILWFLFSLFVWKYLLPLFHKTSIPIVLSLLCSFFVSSLDFSGYFLSISRIFTFFPFFLIGHYYGKNIIEYISMQRKVFVKYLALLCVSFAFLIIFLFNTKIPHDFLYGSLTFKEQNISLFIGVSMKFLFYIFALYISFFVVLLIPRRIMFFTFLGVRSLYVYLIHGFIVLLLTYSSFLSFLYENYSLVVFVLILTCFSVAISYILSREYITRTMNDSIISPVFSYLSSLRFHSIQLKYVNRKYIN